MPKNIVEKEASPRGAFVRAPEMAAAIPMPLRSFHLAVQKGLVPSYRLGKARLFIEEEVFAAIRATRTGTVGEILR